MARKKSRRKSRKRRSPVRIVIKNKGSLTKLGYSMSKSSQSRHVALGKAVRKYGYRSVMGKVNALYVFNKNNNPSLAKKASSDKKWLKKTYGAGMGMCGARTSMCGCGCGHVKGTCPPSCGCGTMGMCGKMHAKMGMCGKSHMGMSGWNKPQYGDGGVPLRRRSRRRRSRSRRRRRSR